MLVAPDEPDRAHTGESKKGFLMQPGEPSTVGPVLELEVRKLDEKEGNDC